VFLETIKMSQDKIIEELRRLHAGHITEAEVLGKKFKLNPHVLRPDISETSEILAGYIGSCNGVKAVDLGSGSGIQTYFLFENGASYVVAIDINPHATKCTQDNNLQQFLDAKLEVITGDMLTPLIHRREFGLVVCNVPYFEGEPNPDNPLEYAWFGGTRFMESLLTQLPKVLIDGGKSKFCYSSKANVPALERLLSQTDFRVSDKESVTRRDETYHLYTLGR